MPASQHSNSLIQAHTQKIAGTVVLISSVEWNNTWQRHHDIAAGLASRGYRVLFVQPLAKRWPPIRELKRVVGRLIDRPELSGSCPQDETSGVECIPSRSLPDTHRCLTWINRIGPLRVVARAIGGRRAHRPLIAINYLPTSTSLALQRMICPQLVIYDCVTDWANDPFSTHCARVEPLLFREANIVFADSPKLIAHAQRNHHQVYEVGPAVHYKLFSSLDRPPATVFDGLAGSPTPRCAYFGSIGPSIDIPLLIALSYRCKLRLIGPIPRQRKDFSTTTDFIGPLPHDEIPAALIDIDRLVLPYRRTRHNESVIPAKTYQCLATGKETVSVGLPVLAKSKTLAPLFTHCAGPDTFLERALAPLKPQISMQRARRRCAANNDWRMRLDTIEGIIGRHLQEPGTTF